MKAEYDVIVIGGGITGLATGAYLAKTGLKVAIFEANNEVGQYCGTDEVMRPGVRCNLHASALLPHMSQCYEDLEMERFGYEPCMGEWGYFYPTLDGTCCLMHNYDNSKTYEAWKLLNKHDAEVFRQIANYFSECYQDFYESLFGAVPNLQNFGKAVEIFLKCPGIPTDAMHLSAVQIADKLFEDERIKLAILSYMTDTSVHPWIKGISSMVIIPMILGGTMMNMMTTARGGSHLLPHSLLRCFTHYGGEVFQSCAVERIIVENGEAKGVELAEDSVYGPRQVMGKVTVSNVGGKITFLDMVGPQHLPWQAVLDLNMIDNDVSGLHTVLWLLNEPLEFKCFDWTDKYVDPRIRKEIYQFNYGVEKVADISRLLLLETRGELPDPPIGWGGSLRYTMIDSTQAPPGMHTVLAWANVSLNMRLWRGKKYNGAEAWDEIREPYSDAMEDSLAQYAPNIKTAKVERYSYSVLDCVRRNPTRVMGLTPHTPNYFYHNRPFPHCGAPRTPIKRLYTTDFVSSPGTWLFQPSPVADVVREDLDAPKPSWWKSKQVEPFIRMLERRWGRKWKMKVD